jgi:hypothetical protein
MRGMHPSRHGLCNQKPLHRALIASSQGKGKKKTHLLGMKITMGRNTKIAAI